jgi:Ca-activated chloride channel family protein
VASVIRAIRSSIGLAAVALASLAAGAPVLADTTLPAVLILDSSGSMAGKTPDGRMKLDAARSAVGTMLGTWPAEGQLAIVAYGHRRKSDCADIETLVPLGAVAPDALAKRLKALSPRGKTPLSRSLQEAAHLLSEAGGAIVLVSDGIETCDADPCAVASALKAANARLFIHVVGFGIAREEVSQLACIAENAGGRFFDAGSAEELAKALTVVSEAVAEPPLPTPEPQPEPKAEPQPQPPLPAVEATPEPAAAPPAPPPVVRVELKAVAGGLGAIVEAPVRWKVVNSTGATVYEGESRALSLDLPAGPYRVTAAAANAATETGITVASAAGESHAISIPAGRLDLTVVTSKSAEPMSDLEAAGIEWTLQPQDGQGAVTIPGLAKPSLLLAPGRYLVRARLKGLQGEAAVEVVAGKPAALTIDFKLGTLLLEAVLTADSAVITDATMLKWRIGEGDAAQVIAGEARPRLTLPEGRVPVTLTIAGADIAATAEVKSGEESIARIPVGGGELILSARLAAGAPPLDDWRETLWTISAVGGSSPDIQLYETTPTVPRPPGRWRVTLKSGAATKATELLVAPGQSTPVAIELGAARLTLRAGPAEGERAANTVFSVFAVGEDGAAAGEPAFGAGASDEVTIILPAGRWRAVLADSEGRTGTADLTLAAGERPTVEVPLK